MRMSDWSSDVCSSDLLISVDAGATVSGLVGVLDYGTARYTVLPDPGIVTAIVDSAAPTAVSTPGAGEITVAGFNLLRFFDDSAANNTGSSPTLTPVAFQFRLRKTATANIGKPTVRERGWQNG